MGPNMLRPTKMRRNPPSNGRIFLINAIRSAALAVHSAVFVPNIDAVPYRAWTEKLVTTCMGCHHLGHSKAGDDQHLILTTRLGRKI